MRDKIIEGIDDTPENVAKALFRHDPKPKRKPSVKEYKNKTDKVIVIREVKT